MRLLVVFTLMFLMISHAAQAQDMEQDKAMKSAVCKLLQMQSQKPLMPNIVAGANYQAGVDAYGNSVALADVDNEVAGPESLIIPIEIDLAEKFDIPNIGNIGEAQVGTAEIQSNGRVLFGGNDVTGKIHDWCGTPVPAELDIQKPIIEAPTIIEPLMIAPKGKINEPIKVEIQPVEIKPVIAKPPLEITDNKGSNEANMPKILVNPKMETNIETNSDIITGTDYRDYNE